MSKKQKKQEVPITQKSLSSKPITHVSDTPPKHGLWLGVCLLFTLLAYLPIFDAQFVNWDDPDYVENFMIRDFQNFGKFFTTPIQGNYHPLTMISLAFNYAISGDNPLSYHVLNLLLHLANTALAYWLAWRLSDGKFWVALVTGLLFGIHPMHVESVAWVSERKDVLYGFFFLFGLLMYKRYTETPSVSNYLTFSVLFILSLMSKPAAVVFPVVLLALDWWLKRPISAKLIYEKLPHFALALLMGYLTMHGQETKGALDTAYNYPIERTLFFGFYSFMVYVFNLFIPANLCTFNGFPAANEPLPLTYTLAPIFSIGLGVLLWFTRNKSRLFYFTMAFFILNLALVLQFFIVGSAIHADRYSYIPYWSGFFLLGYGLHYWVVEKNKISETVAFGLVGLVALIFTRLSYQQSLTWQTPEALWDNAIDINPSSNALVNRAVIYREKADNNAAFDLVEKALAMNKQDDGAYLIRANIYSEQKEYDKAMADYARCLEINPKNASAYSSRGTAFGILGKFDKALTDVNKAISLDSTNANNYLNRGYIYLETNNIPQGISELKHYLSFKADDANAHYQLSNAYLTSGDRKNALVYANKSLELNPNYGEFFYHRAKIKLSEGDKAGALADVQKAIALKTEIPADFMQLLNSTLAL
jgi:protein O-mannosyl-transferase